MAIEKTHQHDGYAIYGFPDDVRAAYQSCKQIRDKIGQFAAALAAVQSGSPTPREIHFATVVQAALPADELARVAALLPMAIEWCDLIEAQYPDYI